jgi:hypothetical protein
MLHYKQYVLVPVTARTDRCIHGDAESTLDTRISAYGAVIGYHWPAGGLECSAVDDRTP